MSGKTRNTGYLQNIIQYDENDNIILPSLIGVGTRMVVANALGLMSTQTIPSISSLGGLSGSGTANYLLKYTGSNTTGVSRIQDDGVGIGLGGVPVSGYAVYLHTDINDGSFGIDSSASINALYLLKSGTKNFEISYDTSGSNKIFRLLPYQSTSFFQIGNPSNAGNDYVFVAESTYGNVLIGPGLANGNPTITGATASIHKIQLHGKTFVDDSIQASSFIKTSGTSSQFLKADGSVDTNSYLTSFTETDPIFVASPAHDITNTQISHWDTSYGWGDHSTYSYATQTYVGTAIANLIDTAPGTLDTLNELAAALGDDPNFATSVATSIGTKEPIITAGTTSQYWRGDKTWQTLPIYTLNGLGGVPTTRTITINGTALDLSADRSFTINSMVYPGAGIAVSTGTAWGTSITDNSTNWNTAYGWGNHASAGYLTTSSAASTYVSLTGSYANPSWITSLAYSKITGVPAFLTSYTETDTLATVTGRGASTTTRTTFTEVGATRAGSDTVAVGPWFRWTNVAEDRQMLVQLNASNGLTYWAYNGSAWATALVLTQAGAATFSSSVSATGASIGRVVMDYDGTDSWFRMQSGNRMRITTTGGTDFIIPNTGNMTYNGNTVWHAGNLTNLNQLSNGPGYITGITSANVTGALGYTPYNSSNPNGYITNALFGAGTTSGTLDWNDVSNTRPGGSSTLLLGTATNGMGGGNYYHPFNLEYSSKDGTGNVTQMAIAYGSPGNELYMRGRYSGSWSSWVRFLNTNNYNSYSPTLTGGGASGTWGINVTGSAGSVAYGNITSTSTAGWMTTARNGSGSRFYLSHSDGHGMHINSYTTSGSIYLLELHNNTSQVFGAYADGTVRINNNIALHAGNYSSYALPLSGGVMTGSLVNNTDGAVILESNASENNNWLWKESSKAWGLFWFNRGSQSGQTIGGYTTVGAELMFMGGSSGIAMPTGWTGYIAGSNIAAMISNYNGYIYSASTIYAATSMVVGGNTVIHAGTIGSQSVSYASNSGGLDGYTWGTAGKSIRGTDIYNDGWFRNYNSLQGLYNQSLNQHLYASGTLWNITSNGGGDGGLILRTDHQTTIKGYFYYNSSGSGLLNNSGNWGVRMNYGGDLAGGQLYGPWSTANLMVYPISSSWAEGIAFSMPSTSTWGGLRWRRERAGNDGNFALGYVGYNSSDDLVFIANNGGTQINDILKITKGGLVSMAQSPDGATLILGNVDHSRVYGDTLRNSLVINSLYYPHLYLNATGGGNPTHGPVISMTGNLSGGGYRRWSMGIGNLDPSYFSIGWYDNNTNPHYGVGHNWASYGGRFVIDTSGNIWCTGDITAYGAQSDIRLKTIKGKVDNALEGILKLNGYRFDWKERDVKIITFKEDIGVIAQEVVDVFPELARTGEDGWMSVRYQGLTAVLIEAVKEQQTQIESQKTEIDELKDLVKQLINR